MIVKTWRPQKYTGVLGIVLDFILKHPNEKVLKLSKAYMPLLQREAKQYFKTESIGEDHVTILGVRVEK